MLQLKLFYMKTIKTILPIVALAVVSIFTARAQYAGDGEVLYYKAGNVYASEGGVKLTKANALSYFSSVDDYERYWLRGKRLFTAGIVTSSVGAGIVLGSVIGEAIIKNSIYDYNPEAPEMHLPVLAWMGAAVGGTLILVSVPLYWVGTVKLKKAAAVGSTGHLSYAPELSFVTQSGGIGLALNF